MVCPRCNGSNISVQSVSTGNVGTIQNKVVVQQPKKSKGCLYWMIIGWWLEPIVAIFKLFLGGKARSGVNLYASKNIMKTVAVCQDCGMTWNPPKYGRVNTTINTATNSQQQSNSSLARADTNINEQIKNIPKWSIPIIIVGVFTIIMMFCGIVSMITGTESTNNEQENEESKDAKNKTDSEIDNHDYDLSNDVIVLKKYKGDEERIKIKSTYTVDGKEYKVDLSDFQVSKKNVKTVIFGNGIREINNSAFNSSEVKVIYFPKSMKSVYDNTLAYLHPNDNEKIQVYYEGTKKQWKKTFKEYERKKFDEAEGAEEKGKSVADKLNKLVGMEYNKDDFKYHYLAKEDDVK